MLSKVLQSHNLTRVPHSYAWPICCHLTTSTSLGSRFVPCFAELSGIPALIAAFKLAERSADLIFCDRSRLCASRASNEYPIGVVLDAPSTGVAKSILIGGCNDPASRAGSTSALLHAAPGEQAGTAVGTATGVKPHFKGHRISLPRTTEFTLAVCDGFRIPRPTRDAARFVTERSARALTNSLKD